MPARVGGQGYLDLVANMNNPAGRLRYWLEERTEGVPPNVAMLHVGDA